MEKYACWLDGHQPLHDSIRVDAESHEDAAAKFASHQYEKDECLDMQVFVQQEGDDGASFYQCSITATGEVDVSEI